MTLAGDSVVETAMGVVMIRGALPGEEVRLRTEGHQRGVEWGRLLQVLSPSPDRVEPSCPLAERCGGCPLMTLAHPAQLEHKRGLVARALAGLTRPGLEVMLEAEPNPLHYRRRARLAFHGGGSGRPGLLGYRLPASRELLDVTACAVLEPALEAALSVLRAGLLPELHGRGELSLSLGREGRAVVQVEAERAQPPTAYRAAERLAAELGGLSLAVEGGAPARWGSSLQEQTDAGAGFALSAPADGFAQANSAVNARLVARVRELAEPAGARILELYAGHGNLTLPLAAAAAELHAVEADAQAGQALRANLAAHGLAHTRVSIGPAERHVGSGPLDVVVLDPPRAGAREALDPILARRPARIVYVSCQPPTLRRDLQQLAAGGYQVDAAVALDMFPHTGHVEAVVRLVPIALSAAPPRITFPPT
jgi:23S rRNA (uracil1939-C5)-methyltransferase